VLNLSLVPLPRAKPLPSAKLLHRPFGINTCQLPESPTEGCRRGVCCSLRRKGSGSLHLLLEHFLQQLQQVVEDV